MAGAVDLQIQLNFGNANEKKAEELIKGFAKKYDLNPYIFTTKIAIQSMVIPHSHPVLTLNTRQTWNEKSRIHQRHEGSKRSRARFLSV
jgi:hypothetical protein